MATVTVTIQVDDDYAPTIAKALDKVADEIMLAGYLNGRWDETRAEFNERHGGKSIRFNIARGY